MASSSHWLASGAAMAMLERGGNAFDAVAAAVFTLQVVEPHQSGPGGDMVLIFAGAEESSAHVLCGQGPAPATATIGAFHALGLDLVPGSGLLPATVPGATPALLTLLRDHGTLRLGEVLVPAIGHARAGYPLGSAAAQTMAAMSEVFTTHWPTSAAIYPARPHEGSRFTNEPLARMYERLVREAEGVGTCRETQLDAALSVWSQGFVAEAIDGFARRPVPDATGTRHSGFLSGQDLADWAPAYEAAVSVDFRGHTVCKPAAWSQGPVLLQQLKLLEPFELVPGTEEYVHLVVEAAKLAFADREAWYGDVPDVPLPELLSESYAAQRRVLLGESASLELRPGSPGGRTPRLPGLAVTAAHRTSDVTTAEPTLGTASVGRRGTGATGGDTVHVDVVDRWGTMIAAMPSGGWLQSSPVIPELGFALGNRLQMTWLQEGLASSLMPGRRPRTTLSPTLVLQGGRPVLACGSPGGDQQDQWQLLFLLRRLTGNLSLQGAMEAPVFHSAHFPGSFYPRQARPGQLVAEERLGSRVLAQLATRGHEVVPAPDWSLGRMCAVGRAPEGGFLTAAADPRGGLSYATGR
ncbi:gamma-glutamyltransferase family protein [Streptomyces sp. NPDC056500]|uniref:gamma-glutamyltransferase family protein n=1 Tax=Streptomyces sp. NPDC056500 TaxID=3345840 RepID=UPI003692379C